MTFFRQRRINKMLVQLAMFKALQVEHTKIEGETGCVYPLKRLRNTEEIAKLTEQLRQLGYPPPPPYQGSI